MICNSRHLAWLAVVMLTAGAVCIQGAEDQLGFQQDDIHLLNFHSSGLSRSKDNNKEYSWNMLGESADIRNGVYDINMLQLIVTPNGNKPDEGVPAKIRNYDPGEVRIDSPLCQFNQQTAEIRSQSRIKITAEGFVAEGLGYDIYLRQENLIMTIRNSVKITFRNDKIKTFDLK